MDELVKLVAKRANISDDQARAAVSAVIGFLKEKLPAPVAGQIDGILAGGTGTLGQAGDIAKGIGGLFGKK